MKTYADQQQKSSSKDRAKDDAGRFIPHYDSSETLGDLLDRGTIAAKLKVGSPDDPLEREADRVADRVLRMPDPQIQRQVEEEEEEELLQTKTSGNTPEASAELAADIQSMKGGGRPLPERTRIEMENKLDADFGDVRIHTDANAARLNREIGAQAFTYGNNICFNSGNFHPETQRGKHLLSHELAHVIQQGAALRPMIQRNGGLSEPAAPASSGGTNPLARLVAGILRDQLSNTSMQGHLSSLGTALQGLAVESTVPAEGAQPATGVERLAALNIAGAFESTARAIINDRAFRAFRQRLIGIVGSSDEVALVTALSAALALVLADIPVRGTPSRALGAGFSVGGSFDFGTIRSLQFRELSIYAQYAASHFQTRLAGTVSRDQETGDFAGSGTGQIRLGTDVSHLMGRVTINHRGELTLVGRLSSGYTFGGGDRLVFTTDLSHTFSTGETIIQPGVSGRFSMGRDQSLRLGSQLQVTSGRGLTGLTGYIEYRRDQLRLRIEGSMTGLGEASGLVPGGDMRIQGMLTIPFD